ncbi:TPA: type 1 fimbrial protein, partial [Citrobacter freundii]|nr:type 1 fimbrial protein [Citrobacter freundii]HEG4406064.1 type 1 fimbrial protein [Citrobacter freundii]
LKLECNGVYSVATNPVTLKISSGDWSDDGLTLKNTLPGGALGVGFNIYSGSDTSIPLKNGSVLKRIKKMGALYKYHDFIVSARYARINGESLRSGKVQSKVVFTIAYD